MESTLDNPFAFFDHYFKNRIFIDWIQYRDEIVEHVISSGYSKIDEKSKSVEVFDGGKNDLDFYLFERHIDHVLNNEAQKTKNFIEYEFQNRFVNKNEILAYSEFLEIKVERIKNLKAFKEFTFLHSLFDTIIELIESYANFHSPLNIVCYSFNLLSTSELGKNQKISKLYDLLVVEPALINSSFSEFKNAFSGNDIQTGIKWLVIGKNKDTSKVSLFYFLDKLMENNFLDKSIIHDLSKYILYTFRDKDGLIFKNLKNSKGTISANPSRKQRIDSVIANL